MEPTLKMLCEAIDAEWQERNGALGKVYKTIEDAEAALTAANVAISSLLTQENVTRQMNAIAELDKVLTYAREQVTAFLDSLEDCKEQWIPALLLRYIRLVRVHGLIQHKHQSLGINTNLQGLQYAIQETRAAMAAQGFQNKGAESGLISSARPPSTGGRRRR